MFEWIRENFWSTVGILVAVILVAGLGFFFLCLNHITLNQFAIYYDSYSGAYWKVEKPGWYITSMWVRVSYITTLPVLVTVPSDAKVIVQKYVRFRPEGWKAFVDTQGFGYYTNIANTLTGYAFSGTSFPFLEIVQDAKPEQVPTRNR